MLPESITGFNNACAIASLLQIKIITLKRKSLQTRVQYENFLAKILAVSG